MTTPVDNAESRLANRERHVVGGDRLGKTLQGERANLFRRYAPLERHVHRVVFLAAVAQM